MSRQIINADTAIEADIYTPANRNFSVSIDAGRSLTGDDYQLQVKNTAGTSILALSLAEGIAISETIVSLTRTHLQMHIATGVYQYDLVELKNGHYTNVFKGLFVIEPSVSLSDSMLPGANISFPFIFPLTLS